MTAHPSTDAESLKFSAPTVWAALGVAATLMLGGISATWYISQTLNRIENGIVEIQRTSWSVKDARRYHNELHAALKATRVENGRLVLDFPPPYPPESLHD